MAGALPKTGENGLGNSVSNGKTTGSTSGPTRTHLGAYCGQRELGENGQRETADRGVPAKFGEQLSITERDKKMMEKHRGFKTSTRSSASS